MSSGRRRSWIALPLVGALVFAVGCGAEGPEPADDAAHALTDQQAAGHDARAKRRGPGGPEHLLFAALQELELTDAQKATIEGAIEGLRAARKDHGPKDRASFTALAAGVRAGKIDTAAVLAQAGVERGHEERATEVAAALTKVHDVLTREQRRALVDAVAKRMEEHGPPDGPPQGGRGRGGPGRPGPGAEHRGQAPVWHLLEGIEVSDAQRAAIDKALEANRPAAPDHEAMKQRFEAFRAQMRARLEGFAADSFDARAFVAPPSDGPGFGPKEHHERMLNDLAVVVPILDAAQREALASRLEQGPPGPMGPRPGDRPRGPHGARRR